MGRPSKLLAVDRMADSALWRHLVTELSLLSSPQLGLMGPFERRARAARALECAYELKTRGTQLTLPGMGVKR